MTESGVLRVVALLFVIAMIPCLLACLVGIGWALIGATHG